MNIKRKRELAKLKPGDRVRPRTDTGPGLTKQEFEKETNINHIMARYRATGVLPAGDREMVFADVSQVGNYGEMVEKIRAGEEAFNSLSAEIRGRFANDPVQFVEFLQDERNREEAVRLGLLKAKEPPVSAAPEPTPPAPAAVATPKA